MGKLLQNNDRTNWFDNNKKKIGFRLKVFCESFNWILSKIGFRYLIVNDYWLILAGVILTDLVDDFDFQNQLKLK